MFDVVRFLKDNGIEYWDSGNNVQEGWVNVNCPFCDDPSNHGGFNLKGSYYNCWRCGWHSLVEVVEALALVDSEEAKRILFQYDTRGRIVEDLNLKIKKKKEKVDEVRYIPDEKIGSYGKHFLLKRGFDPDYVIEKYDLRWGGEVGDWKFRIIIPIRYRNRIIAFQGRDVTGLTKVRYLTSPSEINSKNPKDVLYNVDRSFGEKVGVVEGPTDVWRMGDGFVATMGTSVTPGQLKLLGRWKKVFIIFDSERNALKEAWKIKKNLEFLYDCDCRVVNLEKGDPGDLTDREARKLRKELGF